MSDRLGPRRWAEALAVYALWRFLCRVGAATPIEKTTPGGPWRRTLTAARRSR